MDGSTANLLCACKARRTPHGQELLTLLPHAGTGAEEPRTLAGSSASSALGAALSWAESRASGRMDASRALLLRLVTELHRRYYLSRPFSGARLTGTTDFGNFLLPFFYGAREEFVYLLALDAAGRLLTCTCLSEGSVNSANVPMRKLMRAALSANASGVVLAHNHPAGIALPSHEDVELTRRLQQALDVVDILLLDHLVIADDDFVSLRDSGYLR
ncbi:MAG: JAB domain-containing protein [Oscillospiraceae bacterium]